MTEVFGVQMARAIERAIALGNVSVTVTRETSVDDPTQPWAEDATSSVSYTTKGWLARYRQDELSDNILATDRKLMLSPRDLLDTAGDPVVPAVTDTVTIGGAVYNIIALKSVEPAGTPLLYVIQLRS